MSEPVLFVELWAGIVAVVGVGAAVINRRRPDHRPDPSSWVRAMDSYLDERLSEQHWNNPGHICGAGCERLGYTDDWRKGMLG